jgi:hypothetical protein
MVMTDKLSGACPRTRHAQPENGAVKPSLQQDKQALTCDSFSPVGNLKISSKLPFEHAIHAFNLLLLP